ncbi:putative membrane protein [Pedobacter sp. UYP24]
MIMNFLKSLSRNQYRLLCFVSVIIVFVPISRFLLHKDWFFIGIFIAFFGFIEVFEYGRRRSNSKTHHFRKS